MRYRPLLTQAALLALALATTTVHAEYWTVSEGQRGEWRGLWQLKASSGDFRISLRQGDVQITADGFYIRSGNVVSIARTRTSDGNDCHYMGTISGATVNGTAYCASGGPYRWSAVIGEFDGPGHRPMGPQPPQR